MLLASCQLSSSEFYGLRIRTCFACHARFLQRYKVRKQNLVCSRSGRVEQTEGERELARVNRLMIRTCRGETELMTEATHKKVIVIGDGYVGKTCFVSKVTENRFIPNYKQTFGGMHVVIVTHSAYIRKGLNGIDNSKCINPSSPVEYGVKTIRRGDHDIKLKVYLCEHSHSVL